MEICGQEFSPAIVARLRQTLHSEPELSRTTLSRRVCEWLDWRSPNGHWKEMSCGAALGRLERAAIIRLPRVGTFPAPPPRPPCRQAPSPEAQVGRSLAELQPVRQVWVYALHAEARERLGGRAPAPPPPPADWAEEEFGGARLGDERLRERLFILGHDLYPRSGGGES